MVDDSLSSVSWTSALWHEVAQKSKISQGLRAVCPEILPSAARWCEKKFRLRTACATSFGFFSFSHCAMRWRKNGK